MGSTGAPVWGGLPLTQQNPNESAEEWRLSFPAWRDETADGLSWEAPRAPSHSAEWLKYLFLTWL